MQILKRLREKTVKNRIYPFPLEVTHIYSIWRTTTFRIIE